MAGSDPKPSPNKPWLSRYSTPPPVRNQRMAGSISNAGGAGRDPELLKAMLAAISKNDPKQLKKVIDDGVDVNYLFEGDENDMGVFQTTALHICSQKGHVECGKVLLENGVDPEITASWGQTALMHSVNTQWHSMVEMLIKNGARLNSVDYQGRCSMTYAITNRDMRSMKMLLDAGAAIDIGDHYGHTPIHISARSIDPGCLMMLLTERPGLDLEIKDYAKRTPLQHAVLSGSPDSIEALLDLGADINTLDQMNYTPLTNAINMFNQQPENTGYIGKICQLVDRGCDLNKQCPSTGRTALHCLMCRTMPYHELIEYLLIKGADINVKDWNNCTPLHLALMSNNKALARKLIRENCKLDERGFDIAVMKGMSDIVEIMILGGAKWDKQKYIDKIENTPFYLHDYPEMLSLLSYHVNRVNSLSQAARTTVRRNSRSGLPAASEEFGLPERLREFVILTSEMEDEYYPL